MSHDDALPELVHQLVRYTRLGHQIKQRIHAHGQLDAGALGMLVQLVMSGPGRQGELAERAGLDPSTVSRHVAQLVRAGLIERRPDPDDGRALHLAPTDAGLERIAEAKRRREALLSAVLGDWSEDDLQHLAALLTRLNDAIERFQPSMETP